MAGGARPASSAPADELPVGPLPAAAAEVEELQEALNDEEEPELDEPLLLSGPGSEFIRSDPLGALQAGEALQADCKFHGQPWQFETGRMARLADGSCMLRVGNTTVLATAVSSTTFNSRRDPLAPQFEVRGLRGLKQRAAQAGQWVVECTAQCSAVWGTCVRRVPAGSSQHRRTGHPN